MNEVWKKPPVTLETYQAMVGKEVGVSSWHLIDQSRINVYADVIEDHQFIHVDPERAKRLSPNVPSSWLICALIVGGAKRSSFEALTILPVRAVVQN